MVASLLQAAADPRLLNFKAHPKQRELLGLIDANRIVVAACGRRFGKTKAAAAAALHNLLLVPELDRHTTLGPGERRYAMSVANNQAQARIFLEHALSLVKGSPTLKDELVSATTNELVFRGNRVLGAFPCTSKGARGYAASFVCLDEFAHFFDIEEGGPAVAGRIWAALRPSVAQFGALGRTVLISTPMGSDGKFAELWQKAHTGQIKGGGAFQAPTSDNPLVDQDFLAAEEAALGPDDFRREFGAEFIAGGGAFFDEEEVRSVSQPWKELLPTDAKGWLLAIDPSSARDPTAIALVGRDPWGSSDIVCGLVRRWIPERRRWKPGSAIESWIDATMAEIAALAQRFQARVVSDQYLGGTVIEKLRKHGVSPTIESWSTETQTNAFQNLRARISQGKIKLPDDEQLRLELSRIRTNFRAQTSRVEIPRVGSSHCDIAVALVAAVWAHDRHGLGGDSAWLKRPRPDPGPYGRAISAGILDRGPGFGPERDVTRKPKWYDRDPGEQQF